jgi:hypothetical protein
MVRGASMTIEAMAREAEHSCQFHLAKHDLMLRRHGKWYSVWRDEDPFTAGDCLKENMTLDDVVFFIQELPEDFAA